MTYEIASNQGVPRKLRSDYFCGFMSKKVRFFSDPLSFAKMVLFCYHGLCKGRKTTIGSIGRTRSGWNSIFKKKRDWLQKFSLLEAHHRTTSACFPAQMSKTNWLNKKK